MNHAKKILLIDDDPIVLKIIAEYLANADYSYETAADGQHAWQLLSDDPQQFGVVICDRILPHLHGIDLLKKLRAHPQLKNIPFIMITGIADKQEHIEALKIGVFDF